MNTWLNVAGSAKPWIPTEWVWRTEDYIYIRLAINRTNTMDDWMKFGIYAKTVVIFFSKTIVDKSRKQSTRSVPKVMVLQDYPCTAISTSRACRKQPFVLRDHKKWSTPHYVGLSLPPVWCPPHCSRRHSMVVCFAPSSHHKILWYLWATRYILASIQFKATDRWLGQRRN